jgi:hypothetical protein
MIKSGHTFERGGVDVKILDRILSCLLQPL